MTSNEFQILKYLKPLVNIPYADLLNEFRDVSAAECSIIRPEDRIEYLIAAGLISSSDNFLNITPLGLHELDEYIENQTRLDRVEATADESNAIARDGTESSRQANKIAVIAAVISFFSVIATIVVGICQH